MRFSVAALLLGVSTVVSALPIAHSTSSLDLEGRDGFDVSDMFERDFDDLATVVLYPRVKYQVALHRSDVDTKDEHWSVRFHPTDKAKLAKWDVVHAVSNNKNGKGVLVTAYEERGGKHDIKHGPGYDPGLHNEHHHILGDIKDRKTAKRIAKSLKIFKCEKPYPDHNCVDWTKQAIDHLHEKKVINDEKHQEFTNLYNDHQDAVRKKTDTDANRNRTWGGKANTPEEGEKPEAGPSHHK